MVIGYDRRESALLLGVMLAIMALGGAWFSELALGMVPCKLCLWQRWPYYIGIPLLFAALSVREQEFLARWLAGLAAVAFVISIGLGIYHAGVEWKFWLGPSDCGGKISAGPASVGDFLKGLSTARVVLCNEAAARVLGLSFAGWNALVSVLIALFALRATSNRK